nr:SLC13 family permease [uncultured Oscillibacter sp.]
MNTMVATFIILIVSIILMVTEKIPLALTAMCTTLALCLCGCLSASEAIAGFSNSNVILIGAFLIIGQAIFSTGIAHDIARFALRYAKTEKTQILAICLVTALLSGFLSNTGVTAMMMPIVMGVCHESGVHRSKLMMPISIGAGVGGTITLIGTVVNVIANTTMTEFGYEQQFSMFEFTKIGLPLSIITSILLATVLRPLLPDYEDDPSVVAVEEENFSSVPQWKKTLTVVLLIIAFLGMCFESQIGIKLHITASVCAALLCLTGILNEKEAMGSIHLKTIFILAGLLPLSTAMNNTGAGQLLADKVVAMAGNGMSPLVLMAVLYIACSILTQFISNTAAATIMCTVGCSIAQGLNADPRAILMAIVLGASFAYATPLGMPANTLVMGIGGYRFQDYTKVGLPLVLISFVYCMILLPIFYPLTLA